MRLSQSSGAIPPSQRPRLFYDEAAAKGLSVAKLFEHDDIDRFSELNEPEPESFVNTPKESRVVPPRSGIRLNAHPGARYIFQIEESGLPVDQVHLQVGQYGSLELSFGLGRKPNMQSGRMIRSNKIYRPGDNRALHFGYDAGEVELSSSKSIDFNTTDGNYTTRVWQIDDAVFATGETSAEPVDSADKLRFSELSQSPFMLRQSNHGLVTLEEATREAGSFSRLRRALSGLFRDS